MADNVTIQSGANSTPPDGTVVSTDEVTRNSTTQHMQVIKIGLGAESAFDTLVDSGQQTMANSVPVTIASDQSAVSVSVSSGSVVVADGGGSLTVDGTTYVPDVVAGGTINALNGSVQIALAGRSGVGLSVSGGATLILTPEISMDGGATWLSTTLLWDYIANTSVFEANGQNTRSYSFLKIGGATHARVIAYSYTSGVAVIELRATAVASYDTSGFEALPTGSVPYLMAVVGGTNSSSNASLPLILTTSAPSAGERGLVTRNIPNGTQTISGAVTVSSGSVVVADGGGKLTVDTPQLPSALVGNRLDVNVGNTISATVSTGSMVVADGGGILTIDTQQLPLSLVNNRLDVNVGNAITISSGSVVVADGGGVISVKGNKSNNASVPSTTNLGVLPAVATSGVPSYSEGNQVGLSTNLSGALRIVGAGAIDTELPDAVGLVDGLSISTATYLATDNMVFNGISWDMMRGDITNGVDVDVTRVSSGSVVVADGGGSLTVDTPQLPSSLVSGRLDVNVGNTITSTISSGSVVVADGGGKLTVDVMDTAGVTVNPGDATNNAVRVNLVAGGAAGGTSMTDDTAFTPASTAITPAGGTYRSSRDALDDNDAGVIAINQRRGVFTTLEDSSSNEIASATTTPAGTERGLITRNIPSGTQTTTGSLVVADGGGSITIDTPQLPSSLVGNRLDVNVGNTVTATVSSGSVVIADGGGNITIDGSVSITGAVDTELPSASALADTTSNPTIPSVGSFPHLFNGLTWDRVRGDITNGLDVDVTRVTGTVTTSGSVVIADGGGSITVDTSQLPSALVSGRLDVNVGNTLTATISSGSVVVADGGGSLTVDTSQLPTSLVSNRLDVNVGNTPSVTISSGTVSVSSGSVIVADGGGIISIDGTVTANQGTAAAQSSRWPVFISDGSAERVGQQTMANSIPVTIASNQSAVPVTVSSGSVVIADGGGVISVEGVIPHDSPASNIPVLIGASHETMADAVPDNRVTADGDVTRLSTTDGALFVIPTGPQTWQFLGTGVQTGAQVHAAPGPGLSLYVTDITFSIGAATASSIKILNNGGADIWGPHYLEAINGRGLSIRFGTPKKVSVNTRLDVTTTGAATQTVDIQGFTGPG